MKPLLILITLLLSTLNATQALPPLVKGGEPLTKLNHFYIPQHSLVSAVAISADGSFIVSGSGDGSLKIWDTKSGRVLKTLEGHNSSYKC